jgi:hypothetical protein
MDVPFLEQVKIQAQVLVPILKEFQKELGKEKVNDIVTRAIEPMYRGFGKQWWATHKGSPTDKIKAAIVMFAIDEKGNAIDVDELKKTDDVYDFNITRCRYAEFYKELGNPELGSLLVCGIDDPMTEGYGAGVELKRAKTIMKGGKQCEFRYRVKKEPKKKKK